MQRNETPATRISELIEDELRPDNQSLESANPVSDVFKRCTRIHPYSVQICKYLEVNLPEKPHSIVNEIILFYHTYSVNT